MSASESTRATNEIVSGRGTRSGVARARLEEWMAFLPALVAMAWLISKARWFWNHRPDLQFGWIVVLLCAYLLFEAWEQRPPFWGRWTWKTTLCAGGGILLVFLFQIYQASLGMNAASLLGLAVGTILLAGASIHYGFGWVGMKHFAFGFLFILVALPLPSVVSNFVVGGLQEHVAALNVEVLNLMGIPAEQVGSLIRLPNGTVGVDEACSGVRSLQSTVMATLFIGALSLRRSALKGLLLVLGVLLALTGNVVRSVFLSYTANVSGVAALEKFHDAAGWSILVFTAAGVGLLAWAMAGLERRAAKLGQVSIQGE